MRAVSSPPTCPGQADLADTASGMLAIRISDVRQRYVLWFRPQVIRTVQMGRRARGQALFRSASCIRASRSRAGARPFADRASDGARLKSSRRANSSRP